MRRSIKIGLAAAVALLMVGGIAVAAWLTSGNGPGSAKAGKLDPLTVTAASTPTVGDLYPGTTGGDVYVSVTNPNTFPVTLTGATVSGSITPTDCLVTAQAGTLTVNPTTIAAGATATVTVQDALTMGAEAANSCQDAPITVPSVTVSAKVG